MANQHAAPYNPNPPEPVPEPSHAERARTLLHLESVGTLSTISRKQAGFPFGSLMPYAMDDAGRPLFLISTMAMHTQNLKNDPRASLFVTQVAGGGGDVLGTSRVTLVGTVAQLSEAETAVARATYLKAHPGSQYWIDFSDFAFFRLQPVDIYYVGGFGVMGWVTALEYSAADPDPLSDTARGILDHMNADHAEALGLLAGKHAGLQPRSASSGIAAGSARMTSVDRLGFHVRVETSEGVKSARIPFIRQAVTAAEARAVLVEMVQQARHGKTAIPA